MRKNRLFINDELFLKKWQIYKYSEEVMIHFKSLQKCKF